MIKKTGEKQIYSGKVINLFVDDLENDGVPFKREVVRHRGGVGILAEKDGKFAFVKQYRHPIGKEMLEIPAGTRNAGEEPEVTAVRELEEECGIKAKNVKFFGKFAVSPGYTDEIIYLYYANSFENGKVNLDEDEFLTVEWIDKDRAFSLAESGEITDGKTLLALYKYKVTNGL